MLRLAVDGDERKNRNDTSSPAPARKAKKGTAALPTAWTSLANHKKEIAATPLRDLFGDDPKRAERFQLEAAGLFSPSSTAEIR